MRFKNVFLVTSILFLSGCTAYKDLYYDIYLKNVDSPTHSKTFDKTKVFKLGDDIKQESLLFEDKYLKLEWTPGFNALYFKAENKTSNTISVVWDKGVFIDSDGRNYRIINESTHLADENGFAVDSSITKYGFLKDLVYPVGWSIFVPGTKYYSSYWYSQPVFPSYVSGDKLNKNFKNVIETFENKSIRVLLPFKIENQIQEYIFDFEIKNIKSVDYSKF